jgi:hypothetical protein
MYSGVLYCHNLSIYIITAAQHVHTLILLATSFAQHSPCFLSFSTPIYCKHNSLHYIASCHYSRQAPICLHIGHLCQLLFNTAYPLFPLYYPFQFSASTYESQLHMATSTATLQVISLSIDVISREPPLLAENGILLDLSNDYPIRRLFVTIKMKNKLGLVDLNEDRLSEFFQPTSQPLRLNYLKVLHNLLN